MKRILSLFFVVILLIGVFAVATTATAATETKYWSVSPKCLVKSKVLDDGSVPTFKEATGNVNGILVGIPTYAVYGDDLFQPETGYSIKYFKKDGQQVELSQTHLGTADKVVVYDKDNNVAAQYGLVTYGDADGDGVFDALDAFYAGLCFNGFIEPEEAPELYEAVKPRLNVDNEDVELEDYQRIVNDFLTKEELREENLKGRKFPIDETISLESVIYPCDGNVKNAPVVVADAEFLKECVTLAYNGGEAPSTPGIYKVTATVSTDEKYLVTPGTTDLGFMVIAPKTGTGYTTTVDNTNKTIVIDINKPNEKGADLTGYISNMVNSAYSLNVNSKNVASSSDLLTALALRSFDYYTTTSNVITITSKSIASFDDTANAALGCYLPDDFTLWNNTNAQKLIPVSVNDGANEFNYNIVFKQDSAKVTELDRALFFDKVGALRPQRGTSPYKSTGKTETNAFGSTKNYKEVFAIGQRKLVTETNSNENVLRTVVGAGNLHPTLLESLGATGLKTILIGNADTIRFESADKKSNLSSFTTESQLLYDDDMRRYSAITSDELKDLSGILGGNSKLTKFMDLINGVLEGLNIKLTAFSKTDSLIGKTGWVRYACADDGTGLRYTSEMYLEFVNVTAEDDHRSLLVTPVDGCTITTSPAQTITGTYYKRDRMIYKEPFTVTAKLKPGYKLSVTDANGNPVDYDAETGWYIMPNSNVMVTAIPE